MTGVKSFRIDDLLVDSRKNSLEDDLKSGSDSEKSEMQKPMPRNYGLNHMEGVQGIRYSTPPEGSQFGPRSNGKTDPERTPTQEDRRGYEVNAPGIVPYNLMFPLGPVRGPSSPFGSEGGLKTHSYANILPYSFESSRLNQLRGSSYGRLEPSMLPTTFSGLQHAHFSTGMEYMAYPNYIGHYGVPVPTSIGHIFQEKRQFMNERLQYSMYPLNRPLYNTTCKRKGGQIRFNNSQTAQLEKAFVQQKYLNANDRKKLAQSLGLTDRQVKTWFQNRRAKLRKCKGVCTESDVSGSPLDSRAASPYENEEYESPLDAKNDD